MSRTGCILAFAAGAIAGGVVTYFCTKSKFEQQANEDINDMRDYYENYIDKMKEDAVGDLDKEDTTELTDTVKEIAEKAKNKPSMTDYVNRYNQMAKKEVRPELKKYSDEISAEPVELTQGYETLTSSEYEGDLRFIKVPLDYFKKDGILVPTEDCEELDMVADQEVDANWVLGPVFGDFAFDAAEEQDICYIRNYKLGADFEVTRHSGEFYHDVEETWGPAEDAKEWEEDE